MNFNKLLTITLFTVIANTANAQPPTIVFGSTLTMKIQYYKIMYDEEASFLKALIASLVDMKLLPSSLRRLDAV